MKRHRLDPVSLVFGLLYAGVAVSLMAVGTSGWSRRVALVWPLAIVVLGVAILAAGRHGDEQPQEPVERVTRPDPEGDRPVS